MLALELSLLMKDIKGVATRIVVLDSGFVLNPFIKHVIHLMRIL